MKLRFLLAAAAIATLNAQAVTYGNYELAGLVGSGTNTSVCVFDFGTAQYAFGYSYTGSPGRETMLDAFNTAGIGLTIAMTNYGNSENPNYFLDSVSYELGSDTYSISSSTDLSAVPYLYANQWDGHGDKIQITAWTSGLGISTQPLTDGSWLGFTQAKYYWMSDTSEALPPGGAFAAPVPEPAVLTLLAVGGLALFRRRR